MFFNEPDPAGKGADPLLPTEVQNAGGVLSFYSYIMDTEITFEAFLTSYNDGFNSNWNKENVYGRMDPIYTFQNTQRTFGLSFTIPNVVMKKGDSKNVAISMDKLNRFFQFLYPKYGGANALTITQAPLLRIKFANLIARSVASSNGTAKEDGILGAVSSLSMTPKIEHGFSKVTAPSGKALIYPNFIDMQLAFDPIHEEGRFGPSEAMSAEDIDTIFSTVTEGDLRQGYQDIAAIAGPTDIRSSFPYGSFEAVPELKDAFYDPTLTGQVSAGDATGGGGLETTGPTALNQNQNQTPGDDEFNDEIVYSPDFIPLDD